MQRGVRHKAAQQEIAGFRRFRAGQVVERERRPQLPLRQRPKRLAIQPCHVDDGQSPSISLAGHMGKKTPPERTPNHVSSPQRSDAPRSTRS